MNNASTAQFTGLSGDLSGTADHRPALVFLHGLSYNRRIWDPILDGLRRVDPSRQTLTLDLPGHGDSPSQRPHTLEHVADLINAAFVEGGLDAPVVVGHSISGGVASIYASHYPTSGVISLDAPPDVEGFATMLKAIEGRVRGDQFPQVWEMLSAGFRLDLLPASARAHINANSNPQQDVAISYWEHMLTTAPTDLAIALNADVHGIAARAVPYLLITGSELSVAAAEGMRLLPQGEVEVWADSGHFPHFAHLSRFVERLRATAAWPAGSKTKVGATTTTSAEDRSSNSPWTRTG